MGTKSNFVKKRMRFHFFSLVPLLVLLFLRATGQTTGNDTFTWGNATFINISAGEKFSFEGKQIELLRINNHFNLIRIDNDTVWMKVSRRSPALSYGGIRLYVADNRNVKALSLPDNSHGLLVKDALIVMVKGSSPLLDPVRFTFPVDFTDGYIWRGTEESYMFSYIESGNRFTANTHEFRGVGLDMPNSRDRRTNMIIAMENGTVTWVETERFGLPGAAVCIKSESSPGIFYIYENLYDKNILVKKKQKVEKGEGIGYIWGEGNWENLRLSIVRSDTIPGFTDRYSNLINFYPQLLELYHGNKLLVPCVFSRGQIDFGKAGSTPGIARNTSAYEEYLGTGWVLGDWNPADKTEWVSNQSTANARLQKVLFKGEPAQCTNPDQYYTFEIQVADGIFRISANVGDCLQPSWQKVEFEGVTAGTYQLSPGEFTWTPEKIVRVKDGKLTIRIYLADNTRIAGINKIVFQQTE